MQESQCFHEMHHIEMQNLVLRFVLNLCCLQGDLCWGTCTSCCCSVQLWSYDLEWRVHPGCPCSLRWCLGLKSSLTVLSCDVVRTVCSDSTNAGWPRQKQSASLQADTSCTHGTAGRMSLEKLLLSGIQACRRLFSSALMAFGRPKYGYQC